MSHRKNRYIADLKDKLVKYAESRSMDIFLFSQWHIRVSDSGFITVDVWTTGRYYILQTNYVDMGAEAIERGGEKGLLTNDQLSKLDVWLDELFFPHVIRARDE